MSYDTKIPISPQQSRAARGLLGWSQSDLSDHSHVGQKTIADFERGARIPQFRTLNDIVRSFEQVGIEFIPDGSSGEGVRFKLPQLDRQLLSK
ncbi:helix-turn-helix domain-containing protein [Paramagnetospirillum caucaseum]|uniref:Helix-turn-helix domain-containing protein n=1 Tax=Paramagnetospirillum caucaseum TaxID=1244869 RepID=M3A690_9PROT|nr:helix-turn-helix transcriptional regulator [Paramagnetospirillum caucaseum]EME68318.1 helix-turn-helix domain-containing protein [Paramagnetospirillum caucaseum]